jgi:hypothetical protein
MEGAAGSRGFDEGKNLVIFRWMDYGFQKLAGAGFIVSARRRWLSAVTCGAVRSADLPGRPPAVERPADAVGHLLK